MKRILFGKVQIEIECFGHILHEMVTGRDKPTSRTAGPGKPVPKLSQNIENNCYNILKSIFEPEDKSITLTVDDILKSPLFASVPDFPAPEPVCSFISPFSPIYLLTNVREQVKFTSKVQKILSDVYDSINLQIATILSAAFEADEAVLKRISEEEQIKMLKNRSYSSGNLVTQPINPAQQSTKAQIQSRPAPARRSTLASISTNSTTQAPPTTNNDPRSPRSGVSSESADSVKSPRAQPVKAVSSPRVNNVPPPPGPPPSGPPPPPPANGKLFISLFFFNFLTFFLFPVQIPQPQAGRSSLLDSIRNPNNIKKLKKVK